MRLKSFRYLFSLLTLSIKLFLVLLEKNKLRLINEREQGTYILKPITNGSKKVNELIDASFLNERMKQNYLQAYQTRLNKLIRS